MKAIKPTVLIVLDGFGYSIEKKYNAVAHAHMPYFNAWWKVYPHAVLAAAGNAVGLPDNMIGNSEVGHLTIGAGRIIEQPMKKWLQSIADNSFFNNTILNEQLAKLKSVGGALHVLGILSDAGVHGHEEEMFAVIKMAIKIGIKKIVVHAILDGRDASPQSAHDYLQRLAQLAKYYNHGQIVIGSLHGRFYAMDRDGNWDRIEKSYRVLTEKYHGPYDSWEKVLQRSYAHAITDEFIPPTQLTEQAVIHNGDGIVFCNVRPDRARELTAVFLNTKNKDLHFTVKPLNLTFFSTPVVYGKDLDTTVFLPREAIKNTLKDVLAEDNKTIFAVAETEKYAHVTYFFRGENEEAVAHETRQLIPSLIEQDYIVHYEMKAKEITQAVIESLQHNTADFYLINYANADMVGHSGNFGATINALEFIDKQLGVLYEEIVEKMDGTLYITADHGKAEDMFDEKIGQPHTAHTNNPVPFIMLKKGMENGQILPLHELSDIAPFILKNMKIEVPREMRK